MRCFWKATRKTSKSFMHDLTAKKPPLAQIDAVKSTELSGKNEYQNFTIYKSSQEAETSGSIIPPDIAICNQCLKELRDPKDPRFEYFFITCTDCGPRFTIIERLPYDRENTTMREFPLCGFCQKEYEDPANRRFHAQTVACPTCGPKAYLTTNKGEPVQTKDPVREAGKLLSEGNMLAVKGYGGFHIAASTILEQPLMRLRATKHRREKPFAIMAKKPRRGKKLCRSGFEGAGTAVFPRTPNRVAKQKPKLQSFTVGCATPAQRRRHVALHWLALHAL